MNIEKTKNFFNNLAESWDETIKTDISKILTIFNITGLKEGDKVLDIATGTGVLIPYFEEFEVKDITAIDVSDKMIDLAEKKFKHIDNVHFSVEDFYQYDQNGFDYVMCYRAYPHFEDKEAFVKKLYECINKDGRFVIANDESRKRINKRHFSSRAKEVSGELKSMIDESKVFLNYFNIDVLVDTDNYFIISGTKKE